MLCNRYWRLRACRVQIRRMGVIETTAHSRREAFAEQQLNVSSPSFLCVGDGRFCAR